MICKIFTGAKLGKNIFVPVIYLTEKMTKITES